MRNISFMLTTRQVQARQKTVTRRLGWQTLQTGTLLRGVKKGMGLKKGERVEELAIIRVVNVRREPLKSLMVYPPSAYEVQREGFPAVCAQSFMEFFMESHKGCTPDTYVTRIEFEYVEADAGVTDGPGVC